MIIQELSRYYDRLKEREDLQVPEPGFSVEKINAAAVIDENGNLKQVKDLQIYEKKKSYPRYMDVPQSFGRSGSKAHEHPFFLWDNTGFVLGSSGKDAKKDKLKFDNFKKLHFDLLEKCEEPEAKALLNFFQKWQPSSAEGIDNWEEIEGKNIVFQLETKRAFIHENPVIRKIWSDNYKNFLSIDFSDGICSVTGEAEQIPNIHPMLGGVRGAQSSGAAIVSYNKSSFESYGKTQNYNSSVGSKAAFKYTTALKYLLSSNSRQKIQIGDATTIFWSERQSAVEGIFGLVFEPYNNEDSENKSVRTFLETVRLGRKPADIEEGNNFYILGLSPNASRLSVRFWHVSDVSDICEKIGQHFRDLQIIRSSDKDSEFPSLWQILRQTVSQKSHEGPPPLLSGALMMAILKGTAYPERILSLLIERIRANENVNYCKAAVIKAVLTRKSRIFNNNNLEVAMSLDKNNKNPAYLLGRLFAVLERLQQSAIGNANATIKDRFYGSASATPRAVFPNLLKLAQHHISKSDYGTFYDKLIEEIVSEVSAFPAHFTIEQQGLFAIGYYHQRQDLFTKNEKTNNQENENE
ncbi:type I-C CRISPR-associated protein Cas8c/Csd1 [Sedimentisphaera salicampi]|uniref:CRISPR-associated protein Cas8c/Csd1, subtype I-C/DVULG n=1 Tax=Sedimentisphaera salicampi TaxID=1941349 RepID=A0A1W6LLL0_9BACT|nr:type I-C CRISPR-associated protein Cas8c/Csd1 [Sedimentisphaera salicampi]ARN56659.1 CRISPR-associated protein Cas8c/Csd1, subtype I-C/DVULG [Sedimentisphaera salicampi]